jgi:bifunctional enzyme CysN/CysC
MNTPSPKSSMQIDSENPQNALQSSSLKKGANPTPPQALRIVACGNSDDSLSMLTGQLRWASRKMLPPLPKTSGTPEEQCTGANLLALACEPTEWDEHAIGGDITYRFFLTPVRGFLIANVAGHQQHAMDFLAAVSTADIAVLLVDAQQGMVSQARQFAYLISLVGIKHLVLAINNIEQVGYQQEPFNAIVADFSSTEKELGFKSVTAIPLSVTLGDNIASLSPRTPWYQGATLTAWLENAPCSKATDGKAAFAVQSVDRSVDGRQQLNGTLASGRIASGEELRVTASGQTAKAVQIVCNHLEMPAAYGGDTIRLMLDRELNAVPGDVLTLSGEPLEMSDQFEASLIWLHNEPGLTGRTYELKLAFQQVDASITNLKYRVNVNTLTHEASRQLELNDLVVANLTLHRPVAFEPYLQSPAMGHFVLLDKYTQVPVATGLIRHNLRRAQNVHRQALSITREDRERLNGHKGKVIWFTGLSGSGKSTIANVLEKELHTRGKCTYILDGDNIRQGLNKDLGFTDADRVENIRRVAEVAKLMMDAGLLVITAFISPFRAEREMARELIGKNNFVEVFVSTPLAVCEQRDPKGLYKKARSGQIPNMTGINSPYEIPENPDITIAAQTVDADQAAKQLLHLVDAIN